MPQPRYPLAKYVPHLKVMTFDFPAGQDLPRLGRENTQRNMTLQRSSGKTWNSGAQVRSYINRAPLGINDANTTEINFATAYCGNNVNILTIC